MDISTILPVIASAIVTIAGAIAAVITARNKAAETALAAYNSLCASQQARLQEVEDDLKALKAELAGLQAENTALKERIRVLEEEREKLLSELAELKQQQCNGNRR